MHTTVLIIIFISFIISAATCPLFIFISRRFRFQQHVRDDGPRRHLEKAGTPTMGGLVFLFAAVGSLAILAPFTGPVYLALLVTLGSGFIGWLDDYAKVSKARSLGIKARNKLFGQLLITLVLVFFLYRMGYSTSIGIPFTGYVIDLGFLYPVFIFLMISGFSNAVNLTDGIDGLAAGTSIVSLMAFLILSSIYGLQDIAFFCAALIGGCFGFLIFNLHPARIFMGDVGSLALGGSLAAVAVLTKAELSLLIIGFVFVAETVSVIVQVISFRLTGRRVFLMSPLHHHFELKGWSEWQIVTGFWGAAFIFAVIALMEATIGFF